MPTLDDEQFESYLKQFHPLAPEPLPITTRQHAFRPSVVFAAWAVAGASLLIRRGADNATSS